MKLDCKAETNKQKLYLKQRTHEGNFVIKHRPCKYS